MTLREIYERGSEILEERGGFQSFSLRGVETESVLKNNEEVFRRFKFKQRAIGSVTAITETRLLDVTLQVPIVMSSITSPIDQIEDDGLLKVARALNETGSMMFTGSPAPTNLMELVNVGVPIVQTIKPYSDREKLLESLLHAEAAGVTWVGIEVDAGEGTKILDHHVVRNCSPISVEEIKEIKRRLSKPLVLKGILSTWDAKNAMEAGADVIVVSNHGGHTIDYLPHPLEVLDEMTEVISNRIPIIADGGFRRGTDVLKGLAFGAQAIGIGRPILYGLAADGEKGVKTVISKMAEELRRTMTMTGVEKPGSTHRGIIQ